jgi:hypothetical protein
VVAAGAVAMAGRAPSNGPPGARIRARKPELAPVTGARAAEAALAGVVLPSSAARAAGTAADAPSAAVSAIRPAMTLRLKVVSSN